MKLLIKTTISTLFIVGLFCLITEFTGWALPAVEKKLLFYSGLTVASGLLLYLTHE